MQARVTVKLRGHPDAPIKRRVRTLSFSGLGAQPDPVHGPLQRLSGAPSHSDKVWNSNKRQPQYDEQHGVRHEIREDHQGNAADQRHDCLLPSAVNEKAKPN